MAAYNERPPFVRYSDTSEEAADSIEYDTSRLRVIVFRFIQARQLGATCDECEVALDMRHQTASARVRELYLRGVITDSGLRRKTRSGRNAVVWVATR